MKLFEGNPDFEKINGVYYQKDFSKKDFEEAYVGIRTKEGRMYDDETVARLPFIDSKEWKIRAGSAKKLVRQLKKENCKSLIEVGCGNGWLSNYIQRELDIPVCGIDVERIELEQAARVSQGKVVFACADIFSLKEVRADAVLFASSIQYFPDIKNLIERLKGTIHIIDSPFYSKEKIEAARQRSHDYFESKSAESMKQFYFHHNIDDLSQFDPVFLYKPSTVKNFWRNRSPFPWIRIARL